MSKNFKRIFLASLGAFSSLASVNFANASETKANSAVKNEDNNKSNNKALTSVKPINKPKNENSKNENDKSSFLSKILKATLLLGAGIGVGVGGRHLYANLYGPSVEKWSIDYMLWLSILKTQDYYSIRATKDQTDSGVSGNQIPCALILENVPVLANAALIAGEKHPYFSFYSSLRELIDKILSAKEFKKLNFKFDEGANEKNAVDGRVTGSVIISCVARQSFVEPSAPGANWIWSCPNRGIALDMPEGDVTFQGQIKDDGEGDQQKTFKYEATFNLSNEKKLSLKEFKVVT